MAIAQSNPFMASPFMAGPFMERIVRFLMPFFVSITNDPDAVRVAIAEALASYNITNPADLLNAAQVIAFGFAALDTLGEAHASDLQDGMRLRYLGCANSLGRSVRLCEKALPKQRDPAATPAAEPKANPKAKPAAAPVAAAQPVNADPIAKARVFADQVRARVSTANLAPQADPQLSAEQAPSAFDQTHKLIWATALSEMAGELLDDTTAAP
jgi:hypothetical protein